MFNQPPPLGYQGDNAPGLPDAFVFPAVFSHMVGGGGDNHNNFFPNLELSQSPKTSQCIHFIFFPTTLVLLMLPAAGAHSREYNGLAQ